MNDKRYEYHYTIIYFLLSAFGFGILWVIRKKLNAFVIKTRTIMIFQLKFLISSYIKFGIPMRFSEFSVNSFNLLKKRVF